MNIAFIEYLKRVQAMAKTGLSYAQDPYDLERYEELSQSTNAMLSEVMKRPLADIERQFDSLDTYPTPKIDVRGVVLSEGKILLVQEKTDEKWAMPGGWCDIGYSPSENVQKEIQEESGLEVRVVRLLSVWDKAKHNHPVDVNYVYKLNFLCEVIGGSLTPGHEALAASYFDLNDLPPLSLMRNTEQQILRLVNLAILEITDFD